MAFSRGFIGNSNQLIDIILPLMIQEGWEIRSIITEGRDYVFYSTGSDGNQDIYVRIAAGLYDFHIEGDAVQKPQDDGYSEFINFFVYQYFPENGDGYDGYNQVGLNGPVLYLVETSQDMFLQEHNLVTATDADSKGFARITSFIDNNQSSFRVSDGRRRVYFDNGNTSLSYFNIERNPEILISLIIDPRNDLTQSAFYRDPATDLEYLLYWDFNEDLYILNTSSFNSTLLNQTPFTAGFNNFILKGRRIGENQYFYFFQGNSPNWLSYIYETAKYSSFYPAPPDGFFGGNSSALKPSFTYAPKEATGYDLDRIYSVPARFNTRFMSIAIGDDGEPVGGWISHQNVPTGSSPASSSLHCFVDQNDPNNIFKNNGIIFSTTNISTSTRLFFWPFPPGPTNGGSWQVKNNFFDPDDDDTTLGQNSTTHLFNTYTSRLRVSEGSNNSYWISVTKDRISIATKDRYNKYWYNYAGLFETLLSKDFVTLPSDVNSGEVTISVSNTSIFKLNESYQIVDITGKGVKREDLTPSTGTEFILNFNRNYASSEHFTVSDINPTNSTITISAPLSRDYAAGSKIGKDPQPVMTRMQWFNEAATVNNINFEENHDSLNDIYQRYDLLPLIPISISSDRKSGEFAKEIFLATEQPFGGSIDTETRGRLIKTFYIGDSFESEDEVIVNGETYIVIAPTDQSGVIADRYLLGPVE